MCSFLHACCSVCAMDQAVLYCVVCLLHCKKGELLRELDRERVVAMLACVPEGVPMEELSVFSEAVASFLIHHLPDPLVSQPNAPTND